MTLAPARATRDRLRAACDAVNADLARRRARIAWLAVACGVLVLAAALIRPMAVPVVAVFAVGAVGSVTALAHRAVTRDYKLGLATAIVPLLRPGLTFTPDGTIGLDEFNDLRLFTETADRVRAQDEVRGEKNGVGYAVEELRATYTTTTGSGKTRHRTTRTIFRGAVVRLEFNKHFHGHTVVVPRWFGASLFAGLLGGGLEAVTLENPEFAREFVTRSSDQQEARYLLTPRLMETVLAAQAALGTDLRLAFRGGTLHVLINGTRDRFEVSLFGGVTPGRTVADLDEVITLAERLIDTLELETRIWTRT